MDLLKEFLNQKTKEIEASIDTAVKQKIEEVNKLIEELKNNVKLPIIQFKSKDGSTKTELKHEKFNDLCKIILSQKRSAKNILLVGEAGAGKSKLASQVAKYAGLDFYPLSIGAQTTKSDLMGYMNATGEYITTPVREAFEKGGILLLDEIDAGNANTLTILNNLLSNDEICFSDKLVKKHPAFICICTANTYGKGATLEYMGRNRLDSATLDRFIILNIGYDKNIEKTICNNDKYLKIVNKLRKNAEKYAIKIIISPRAIFNGADLLEAGFSIKNVVDMCIFKGASEDVRSRLIDGIEELQEEKKED